MCLCVSALEAIIITSGMIWTPYYWLTKGYNFYMAAVVIIGGGHCLRIEQRWRNQPSKSKPSLYSHYFYLTFLLNSCTQTARQSASVTNVECSVHRRIEVFKKDLALATDQWLCIWLRVEDTHLYFMKACLVCFYTFCIDRSLRAIVTCWCSVLPCM